VADQSKQRQWEELKREARERFGPDSIFGEGSPEARVAFVGEAPGENEVRRGRPFVGRAGQLLDDLLVDAGIDRREVYVTNTVKVRPTREQNGRRSNRPPRVGEIREGLEILLPELRIIEPEVLVPLGNTPARALVGKAFAMGKHRGIPLRSVLDIPALATYHPAYLLRQQGEDFQRIRRLVIEDLSTAHRLLEEPAEIRELEE
jgi:uracil-DNA glycosylase family 4